MALTQKNQLLISYKKLVGKVHTNAKFGTDNESISTNVQTGFSTIFSDAIPAIPNSSVYSITNGTVEKITFSLVGIDLSNYANTVGNLSNNTTIDREGEVATAGIHAYKLVLPADYQTFSSNPKKGSAPFTNSYTASNSNGALQLVAPTYGPAYSAEINSLSGIILESQDEDYVLDYYSGILFLQDIARVPTSVTAYVYIGNYAKDRISIPFLTGTLGISGSHGTFASLTASDGSITNLTSSNIRILNDLFVAGTASVAMLNTVNQQSLQIGDKHIIIMSGATDHATLSGSGILWGSGSTGPTYGPNGEHAYVRYDSVTDKLEIFPGLETNTLTASFISSSNYIGLNVGSVGGVTTAVWSLMTGSTNITVTNGTSSLKNSVTGLTSVSSTGFTGSLNGNASSATTAITAQTASYVATGSAIATFTNDVRKQISGTGVISYNNSTGIISYTGGTGGGTVNTGSAGYIAYYPSLGTTVDDTSQIYTDGTNVGIGTSIPGDKLDVNGGLTVRGVRIYHSASNFLTEFGPGAGTGDTNYHGYYVPSGKAIAIQANAGASAIFLSGANVGIGTTAPGAKLSVKGEVSVSPLGTSEDIVYNGSFISTKPTTSGQHINLIRVGNHARSLGFVPNTNTFAIAGSVVNDANFGNSIPFVIDDAGKVGIGTTEPSAGLHLAGTDGNTLPRLRLENKTPSTGKTWETTSGDDGRLYIGIPTVVDAIVADSNGNVGIGKSIPVKPLDVAKAGGIRISRTESSSSNNEIYFQDNGQISSFDQYHRIIFDRANDKLELREYGDIVFSAGSIGATRTETVTIKNNGNVGINVSNPTSHKLQVNGTISGSAVYGLSGSSAQFPRFSTDVRNQISSTGTGGSYNPSNGVITFASTGISDVYATDNNSNSTNGGATINIYDPLYVDTINNRVDIKDASTTQRGVITTSLQNIGGSKLFNDGGLFTDATTSPFQFYDYASLQIHREKSLFNDPRSAHLVISQPQHESANDSAQLYFGLHGTTGTNTFSWMQAATPDYSSMKPMLINPSGGFVGINKSTNLPNAQLDINGNTIITGTLTVGPTGTSIGTITAGASGLTKIYDSNLETIAGNLNYKIPSPSTSLRHHIFLHGTTELVRIGSDNRAIGNIYGGSYLTINGVYVNSNTTPMLSVNGSMRVNLNGATGTTAVYRDPSTGFLSAQSSDGRFKENIVKINNALEKITNLNGVYYNWTNKIDPEFNVPDPSIRCIGLIAQEVEKILPEAVSHIGVKDYKTVKYSELTSLLIEGIKELKKENDELKNTLKQILEKISVLENK